ncbi:outer membrane beta-barrel protein [Taibaiella koreensis]|uniref:outer membrane beta-barrel protein n=1 Tax=Taibaiella koreensis TaxID=1268548 RepID=UPI0013C2E333|nr:outer membrane beta-barrel protein [Taibaiella koreensis]
MKKIAGLLAFTLAFSLGAQAQESTTDNQSEPAKKKSVIKPSRDFLMLQLSYDNWAQTPENVKIGGIGRGFNAYLCYDFPISKSNFSFAAGLGIGTNNIYFDDQRLVMNTASSTAVFQNVDTNGVDNYKKSKLNTTYLEAPFELRFFGNKDNRNRGFKMAIGMKVGLLVGAHTKEKHNVGGTYVVEKVNTKRYFETWRFTPTARIGWGNFSIFGTYSLSQLFKAGAGPEVYPYSIGICITGL